MPWFIFLIVNDVVDIYWYFPKPWGYGSLWKGFVINNCMSERKICPVCNQRPVAINYRRGEIVYYRNCCGQCSRKGKKLRPQTPQWYKNGYRKKPQCDRCGFKAEHPDQLLVFHVDGNLRNNDSLNLKTVCLNCVPMVGKSRLAWKPSAVVPDY